MLVKFNKISNNSRLWIYASHKKLDYLQQKEILKRLEIFLNEWKYHKKPLTASVTILEDYFIVVALESLENEVGGCSIDSLQRLIQDLEYKLNLSLLNRLNLFCRIDNNIKCIPVNTLVDNANLDTMFYDLTIQTKAELNTYLKPIRVGWCKKFFM